MARALTVAAVLFAASGCVVVADDGPRDLPLYSPCDFDSDCDFNADRCFSITVDHGSHIVTDGMCTLGCFDDRDCAFGGACLSLDGNPALCYPRCFDDFDCAIGFACVDAVGPRSFDAICLPF